VTSEQSDPPGEARERLAVIGEIAAEVAHELRNALQIISANVYLARQDLSKSEPHLAKIERNARLAHGIVDDLMALARGEPAHAEPVLLVDALTAGREALPAPPPTYLDRIEPATLRVRAHVGLLARLLHVLYENAIGASQPRPVTIETTARASADGAWAILEVADDGPGIPDEILATIFEPLVTARPGGTGLGLALARRIVTAHGGALSVVPGGRAVGAETGAMFRVELPLATLETGRGDRR